MGPALGKTGQVMAATPGEKLTICAAGLAGLGCSALLPLTISFGQERLITISARPPVSGGAASAAGHLK